MVLNSMFKEMKISNLFRYQNKKIIVILNIVAENIVKSKSLDLKLNDKRELIFHSRILYKVQKLWVEVGFE